MHMTNQLRAWQHTLGQTKPTVDKLKDFFTCHLMFDCTVSNKYSANLIHCFPMTAILMFDYVGKYHTFTHCHVNFEQNNQF